MDEEMDVLSERDNELLEAYLDGELPATEKSELEERLATEPKLAEELRWARALRVMRLDAFESLEGDEAGANRLVQQVRQHAQAAPVRAAVRWGQMRRVLVGTAAAACVGLGFLAGAGWMGGFNKGNEAAAAPVYQVEIRDAGGNVVAVQKFESEEKARQFTDDLRRWRERQERLMNGEVTVHSASF